MTFEIEGFEEFSELCLEFAEDIREVREGLPESIDNAVEESAYDIQGQMKIELHNLDAVDSGNLLKSIESDQIESMKSGKAEWEIGPTADYAKYVEFGTNPHTITPKGTTEQEVLERREMMEESEGELPEEVADAPALQFNAGGQKVTVDMVKHPGSDAKPFFRTAVAKHEQEERLARSIDKHTSLLFSAKMN